MTTDRSGAICDSYAERDARIRVIHQENGGVGRARNRALDEVTGDFITFSDSDDWVEKEWVETLLEPFQKESGLDVSICGWYRHEGEICKLRGGGLPTETINGCEAFRIAVRGLGFDGYLWNKMYRRECLVGQRFQENITICEDLLFNCEIFLRCEKVQCIPVPLYHYMIRDNSALGTYSSLRESELVAREMILKMVDKDRDLYQVAVYSYVQSALNYVYKSRKYGKNLEDSARRAYKSTKPYIRQALFQKSVGVKARLRLFLMYLSPRLSMELWFLIKRAFGLKDYTRPGDR